MVKRTIFIDEIGSVTFASRKTNNITNGIKALKGVVEKRLMEPADIKLVINDSREVNVWMGKSDELPSSEKLSSVEKILLIIIEGSGCSTELFNNALQTIHNRLPSDTFFLYSIINDEYVKTWNYVIFSQASIKK